MEEREAEYHQEMTEKMNKFLIEHAARVIQHAWREVLANRAEKKRVILLNSFYFYSIDFFLNYIVKYIMSINIRDNKHDDYTDYMDIYMTFV